MTTYKYRFLGTGTTNSQGIAILNKDPNNITINGYTGVGAGKVDLLACTTNNPSSNDAVMSNLKEILDCTKYDAGTDETYNNNMWNSSTSMVRGSSYTSFSTASVVYTSITDNTCIEIDINGEFGTNSPIISLRNNSTSVLELTKATYGFQNNTWYHIIIRIEHGMATITNDVNTNVLTGDVSRANRFYLRQWTDESLNFKNLHIYPI